jgi:putative acetyltransferase
MRIRQYVDNDLAAVVSSWESATRLAHPFMTEEFLAQERKNLPELYLPNADTWVAEINDEVVGFIALIGNEVGAIFVQPTHHGEGAGLALMNKAQEIHGELEVEVFSENCIGRRFYARYGFKQLEGKLHEATGQKLLRLKFAGNQSKHRDGASAAGV